MSNIISETNTVLLSKKCRFHSFKQTYLTSKSPYLTATNVRHIYIYIYMSLVTYMKNVSQLK